MKLNLLLILVLITSNYSFGQEILIDKRDGQRYNTIDIGENIWMKENLNVDQFLNGDKIQQAKTKQEWQNANEKKQPVWCYYNFDTSNGIKFGKLYNWYAANDSRGLAPDGWEIPNMQNWNSIFYLLGGYEYANEKLRNLKAWGLTENTEESNKSGFSSLPSGQIDGNGSFTAINDIASYWSSEEFGNVFDNIVTLSYSFAISNNEDIIISNIIRNVGEQLLQKNSGCAIRCIKKTNSIINKKNNDSISNHIIKSISIGKQTWMAENLSVEKFRNGDEIYHAKSDAEWQKASEEKKAAWCYFNNQTNSENINGKLYNWFAVNDPRGLAPKGWHIPNESDYQTMLNKYTEQESIWEIYNNFPTFLNGKGFRGLGPKICFGNLECKKYSFSDSPDWGFGFWTSTEASKSLIIKDYNIQKFKDGGIFITNFPIDFKVVVINGQDVLFPEMKFNKALKSDGFYVQCISNY
jgi:uncharacterized protein (TIGR02145 family)